MPAPLQEFWHQYPQLSAAIVVLGMSVLLWGILFWYFLRWPARKRFGVRLASYLVTAMAVIIIPRAEMVVYLRMTGLTINTDKRFFAWLIFELAAVIVIFFFYIRKGIGILKRDEPSAD